MAHNNHKNCGFYFNVHICDRVGWTGNKEIHSQEKGEN